MVGAPLHRGPAPLGGVSHAMDGEQGFRGLVPLGLGLPPLTGASIRPVLLAQAEQQQPDGPLEALGRLPDKTTSQLPDGSPTPLVQHQQLEAGVLETHGPRQVAAGAQA
jgi:hypothetical protein